MHRRCREKPLKEAAASGLCPKPYFPPTNQRRDRPGPRGGKGDRSWRIQPPPPPPGRRATSSSSACRATGHRRASHQTPGMKGECWAGVWRPAFRATPAAALGAACVPSWPGRPAPTARIAASNAASASGMSRRLLPGRPRPTWTSPRPFRLLGAMATTSPSTQAAVYCEASWAGLFAPWAFHATGRVTCIKAVMGRLRMTLYAPAIKATRTLHCAGTSEAFGSW